MGLGARMARKNLKVVRLIEPDLCLECRFAKTADVEMSDGSKPVLFKCGEGYQYLVMPLAG